MDIITKTEKIIKDVLSENNYEEENVVLSVSSRPEFGQFQYNGAMGLAKKYKTNPREVAQKIVDELNKCEIFENYRNNIYYKCGNT